MLIEFSVSNFRSFREKQTFSMVASSSRVKKDENVFTPFVKGEEVPDLLKVAAIYGPNASGKSNFIKALDVVREISSRQPSANPAPFPVSTFRFDQNMSNEPSRFELHFISAELRYEFTLALTQEQIVEESLVFYPKGKETLLYQRVNSTSGDKYTLGAELEGEKNLHQLWKNATSPQTLFISQAVANSSSNLNQLRVPFNWLNSGLIVSTPQLINSFIRLSQRHAEKNTQNAARLSDFLNDADVPIVKIRFDQKEANSLSENKLLAQQTKMVLTHKSVLGEAEFDIDEESEGTKNLIGFWMPWFLHQNSNWLNEQYTLVVDEFDSSLHPEIVSYLVSKHINSGYKSQLIFTTHDTHLMDTKLLRRDQFWLTERDMHGATQFRSIHDFEGREGEDIEKRYFEGRYRALPIIRKS